MLATLAALSGSLLGAAVLSGREQRWCLGLSVLCGAFLVLVLIYVIAVAFIGVD